MALRKIGEAVTDSNGNCIIPYTGTGAGEVDLTACYYEEDTSSIIQSETYSVIDASFVDVGTDNTQTHYFNSGSYVQVSYDDTGKTLSNPTSSLRNLYLIPLDKTVSDGNLQTWECDFTMELDFVSGSSDSTFQISDGTLNFSRTWAQLGCTGGGHVRWEIKSDTQKIYVNDAEVYTGSYTYSNVMIRFRIPADKSLTFKNLIVYPI